MKVGVSRALPLLVVAGALLGWGVAEQNVAAIAALPAALGIIAAVVWPRHALLFMLAYVPLESFFLKWVPGGQGALLSLAPEIVLFLAGGSAFARRATAVDADSRLKWVLWIAAFAAAGLVSGWVGQAPILDNVYWVRTNIRYMSAALVVGALGTKEWWLGRVAFVVAVSSVIQSLVALAEFVGGPGVRAFFAPASVVVGSRAFVTYGLAPGGGVAGTLGFYNNFGLFCAVSFVICVCAALILSDTDKLQGLAGGRGRVVLAVGAVAAMVGTLISGSRQSIAALLMAGLAILYVFGLERLGSKAIPIVFFVGIMVTTALLVPSLTGPLAWIPERFGRAVSGAEVSQSLQTDRLFAVTRVVPAVLLSNPILGIGPGTLSSVSKLSATASTLSLSSEGIYYAQDVGWASLVVQMGMVGVSLVVALVVALWRRAGRLFVLGEFDHGAKATVLATILVWCLAMIASSPLLMRPVSLLIWTVAGLCLGGYRPEDDA